MALAQGSHAQELVPNPSFEEISSCPTFASMLGNAVPWTNPTGGTPELFHACAPDGDYAGVPHNYSNGFQYPRTGDGFAGIIVYREAIAGMREYIMAPLLAPLEAGACYTFRMFVNAAEDHELVCDGVGVRFTVGPVSAGGVGVLPGGAHIEHPPGVLISDTVGWTEVSGSYVAAGGEDHLVIGNFRDDASTMSAMNAPGAWYTGTAYLLVDDVSLVRSDAIDLDLGPDTVLCAGAGLVLDAGLPGATSVTWSDGLVGAVRTVTVPGLYEAVVAFGSCSVHDAVEVGMAPLPAVDLGPDLLLCPGRELLLRPWTEGAEVLVWEDGSTAPDRTVRSPGVHHVTVGNTCGTVSDTVVIHRDECPEGIYLPNAFTPDGDALNDRFAPVFDVRMWEVRYAVHDRWGMLVFESPDGAAWSAEGQPDGVYTVRLEARSRSTAERHTLWGHVVLLR